jgi:hypothetical protein
MTHGVMRTEAEDVDIWEFFCWGDPDVVVWSNHEMMAEDLRGLEKAYSIRNYLRGTKRHFDNE